MKKNRGGYADYQSVVPEIHHPEVSGQAIRITKISRYKMQIILNSAIILEIISFHSLFYCQFRLILGQK